MVPRGPPSSNLYVVGPPEVRQLDKCSSPVKVEVEGFLIYPQKISHTRLEEVFLQNEKDESFYPCFKCGVVGS